ncbi:MAG: hypothetical protein J2P40_10945 [Candidatus Dormibacteraeota bacterium]|nr:hypothetical protein [Candidatus Dormibacteraeota bacterium]MBO0761780.1 hypothetical protein [Candidatus Dormibacteraeota bacterium]
MGERPGLARGRAPTGEHPWLERIIIEAEDFPDPDVAFERRIGYVLDGLAGRVSEASGPR